MLTEEQTKKFEALQSCFQSSEVCLVECKEVRTGETCAVICLTWTGPSGGVCLKPIARLIDGDGTKEYQPPFAAEVLNDQSAPPAIGNG